MTALTVPARPEEDASPRPVPWRRMAWVTWRQHRIALAGVVVVVGARAVYLRQTGLQIHQAWAAVAACHPASADACAQVRHQRRHPPTQLPFCAPVGNTRAVPRPARIHAVDELPARQPVLALPVDRGRLAALSVLLIAATVWLVRRRAA